MISRGQIYLVDLDPVHGRKQKGVRPVLVVSADAINRQPLVVTVVAGTDAAHVPRDYPTNIRVPARESGLPKDTIFLCFQLGALGPTRFRDPRTGLVKPVGQLSVARMAEVDTALRAVLSL
jgi:mRNA interferase MazF